MHAPTPSETPHAGLRRVAPNPTSEADFAARWDATAEWVQRVAQRALWEAADCRELIVHGAGVFARWTAVGGRYATFSAGVVVFALLRVPAAVVRGLRMAPAWRPWFAVYPEDWRSSGRSDRDWLRKLPYDAADEDVCASNPTAEAFPLGRTLPLKSVPERWWSPLRRAWLAVHTTPVWVPRYRRFCHTLILGGPGSGKTSRWVIPGIVRDLAGDGHILTIDAKGIEQYRVLADPARRAGVRPVCLDPWATHHTAAVEPLGNATPAELEVLAEALYGGAAARAHGEDFWDAYAKTLLRFLLTTVALFPRASRSVACVAWLATEETARVTQLADALLRQYRDVADEVIQQAVEAVLTLARADDATIADPERRPAAVADALAAVEFLPLAVLDALRDLRAYVMRGYVITREDTAYVAAVTRESLREHCERLAAARRQVRELERPGNEKMAGSTRATLAAHLRAFTLPEVARFFSRPEVDLWQFASAPDRQLLCVGTRPGQGAASEQVTSLVLRLAVHSLYTRNELPDDNPVKQRPVWLYLDEVAQLKSRDLPRHVALVRSMNAGVVMAAQDLSQLRVLYGEEATALENMCATVITTDRLDDATAARYAARCGEVEIHTRVPSSAPNRRHDDRYHVRHRLEAADLRVRRVNDRLRKDAAFQAAGVPHWFARPLRYFEDPDLRAALRLVRSGDRWVPSDAPTDEREGTHNGASTVSPDPFGETVLALVGAPAGAPRPALRVPTVPWRAFGLAGDDDGPAPSGMLGAGARLLPPG